MSNAKPSGALRTPLVLPELPQAPSIDSSGPGEDARGEDARGEAVYAERRYVLAPNASPAGELAETIVQRFSAAPAVPENADVALEDLPPGVRLPLVLKEVLKDTPPNLYLQLSGVDREISGLAEGFEQQPQRQAGHDLISTPALAAWISCETAWWLDLYELRAEVEDAAGVEAAQAALLAVTEALDPVMPVWDPPCAYEFVREMCWFGWSDDSERLDDIRRDLSRSRDCDPEEISDEEAREIGADYFWTTPFVEEVLPEGYQTVVGDRGDGHWQAWLLWTGHAAVWEKLQGWDVGSSDRPARDALVID